MLSASQQSVAVLSFVKTRLSSQPDGIKLLQDPFFLANLDYNFTTLFSLFTGLYGHRNDCLDSLVDLVRVLAASWEDRSFDLKQIDKDRLMKPTWYMHNNMIGGMCYVDLFAGGINGVRNKIPYFKELGLTYLHLLPFFKSPERDAAGGLAISSYRQVDSRLGSMQEMRALAKELHQAGICLVVDFVMNHTSDEHQWAKKAANNDPEYSQFYWMFPDRIVPDEFEKTALTSSRPDRRQGNFKQLQDGRWVWSTFQSNQWDLNYSNPAVFVEMAAELLFLANVGVDIFRMDSVAHIWKRIGTSCADQPEAQQLVQAFNSVCRIAAPSILFQNAPSPSPLADSHAGVRKYVAASGCQLAQNPLEMELGWEALATRRVGLLQQALEKWHNLSQEGERCHWVNYIRSHEEMTWSFSDADAAALGMHGPSHRHFLNQFYVNRFQGSFARGVPYLDDPNSGECRIAGTAASLAGLESGEEHAVERMLLLYSIAFSTGGIALINLGDEVGQLNDYGALVHPDKAADARWVHRPAYPAQAYEDRRNESTLGGKMYAGIRRLVTLRKATEELGGGRLVGFHTDNAHILGYQRFGPRSKVLCLANFHDEPQVVGKDKFAGMPEKVLDLVSGLHMEVRKEGIELRPHQYAWLRYH